MDCPTSWIVSRPDLLGGKPCVRGTRLSVELLLELLAGGATQQEILAAYQDLPAEGLEAALEWRQEMEAKQPPLTRSELAARLGPTRGQR